MINSIKHQTKWLWDYAITFFIIILLVVFSPLIVLVSLIILVTIGVQSFRKHSDDSFERRADKALKAADKAIGAGTKGRSVSLILGYVIKIGFWESIAIKLGFATAPIWILLLPYFTALIAAGYVVKLLIWVAQKVKGTKSA